MAALVRVLALDIDVPSPASWAPREVIARAEAYIRDVDARRFLAGRWLIAQLAGELGIGEVTWRCGTCGSAEHGRPTAPGASISTTRCEGVGAVVLGSADGVVGIDITPREAPAEWAGIAESMFAPAERVRIEAEGAAGFAVIWSAKEALGKARGTGLVDPARGGGPLDTVTHRGCLAGVEGLPSSLVGSFAVL